MSLARRLESQNLVLRSPIEGDILTRLNLGLNPELITMCGLSTGSTNIFAIEDALHWYQRACQHPCKWVIEYKGRCIGTVGLRPYVEDNKAKFSIEIYDQQVYGCGIGTTATKMALRYAFEVLNYHKVFLRVFDFNTRAIKCYEKCGFVREGIDREGACINGSYYSDIYMGILHSEFEVKEL